MDDIFQFFKGKHIFITGGSGFVGKVLIEKLLRAFPDIGNLYVLIRNKKGKSPLERIRDILDNPVFDVLKSKNPSAIDKVKPILGDVTKLKLGISLDDETLLLDTVNVIFNIAASVRFDDPLEEAILTNTRSAREISELAIRCQHLAVMLHVSTAFCNLEQPVIKEEFYPFDFDWRVAVELAERREEYLQTLTEKCIFPMPNTYTFSKRLAEAAAVDVCQDKVPLVILRPSVVVYTLREPIVGWVDNLNGPFTIISAGLKGVISTLVGRSEADLDVVFVDNCVKAMILAAVEKANRSNAAVFICNVTTDIAFPLRAFCEQQYLVAEKIPHTGRLWYNTFQLTSSWYKFYMKIIFTHLTVAIFVDLMMRMAGKKPMLLKVLRRIVIANSVLQYFTSNTVKMENKNYLALERHRMDYGGREDFEYEKVKKTINEIKRISYIGVYGIKKFIFHEPVPVREETFRNTFRLYILSRVWIILRFILIMYVMFWKFDMLTVMQRKLINYWKNLDF